VVCLGRYTPPFFGGSCQTLLMFGKKKVSDIYLSKTSVVSFKDNYVKT